MYGFLAGSFYPQAGKFKANSGGRSTVGHEVLEIVLTLFVKGHLVDPLQDAAYQSLRQFKCIG